MRWAEQVRFFLLFLLYCFFLLRPSLSFFASRLLFLSLLERLHHCSPYFLILVSYSLFSSRRFPFLSIDCVIMIFLHFDCFVSVPILAFFSTSFSSYFPSICIFLWVFCSFYSGTLVRSLCSFLFPSFLITFFLSFRRLLLFVHVHCPFSCCPGFLRYLFVWFSFSFSFSYFMFSLRSLVCSFRFVYAIFLQTCSAIFISCFFYFFLLLPSLSSFHFPVPVSSFLLSCFILPLLSTCLSFPYISISLCPSFIFSLFLKRETWKTSLLVHNFFLNFPSVLSPYHFPLLFSISLAPFNSRPSFFSSIF